MPVLKVGVIGASGYVGAELVSILANHPCIEVLVLAASSSAGRSLSDLYPAMSALSYLPDIVHIDSVDLSSCDVVFLCLPHGHSSSFVGRIPSGAKIIDLGADFRFKDLGIYESIYGNHGSPSMIGSFVFGLSECYRSNLVGASKISCPGCYSTAALLPLIPLVESKVIDGSFVIIDGKSGISGAGKSLSEKSMFCEGYNTFRAYSLHSPYHRHIFEIEQEIFSRSSNVVNVQMTTQLLPINRGIMNTIYLPCSSSDAAEVLQSFYSSSRFVRVDNSKSADVRSVIGTNMCYLGIFPAKTGTLVISIIDNLVKGAAGQAVQNLNLSLGFDEDLGFSYWAKCLI